MQMKLLVGRPTHDDWAATEKSLGYLTGFGELLMRQKPSDKSAFNSRCFIHCFLLYRLNCADDEALFTSISNLLVFYFARRTMASQ